MKFKLASFIAMLLLFSFVNPVTAQNLQVTGKITKKSTGEALVAATVSVKGTGLATQTDIGGNFSLSIPQKTATLVVSYIGLSSIERKVTQGGEINIALDEDVSSNLTEVVVVGYGTQKVTKVSGAISTVKAADIEKLKPVRTEEALQGRASGVSVIQNGSPGSKPTVLIRGIPSFSGVDPVVIIDGSPQTLTDLNAINALDIESINVLKDAATTAIYGVKGGNGVIVVTTKTGKKNQKTEITINSNYGMQEVAKTIGVLNATEYAAMVNEGSTVAGGNVIFPDLSLLGAQTGRTKCLKKPLFKLII